MEKKQKIIIDTDIGTYYDDAFAVLFAAQSPELDILAVTTCYGDTDIRSRIAKKILRVAGRPDIPVCSGIGQPLEGSALMFGFEGENILYEADWEDGSLAADEKHAVDMIIESVMKYPGEVVVVTLGTVTNIAAAIMKEPAIVDNIKELICMAGVVVPVVDEKGITRSPVEEYNFNNDPKAAQLVCNSGINMTLVPIDVTLRVPLSEGQVQRIRNTDTPIANLISDIIEVWPKQERDIYMSVGIPTEFTGLWLHDPLTIAVAIDRGVITEARLHIDVEFADTLVPRDLLIRHDILRTIPKKLPPNMNVAVDVDSGRFTKEFTEKICKQNQ